MHLEAERSVAERSFQMRRALKAAKFYGVTAYLYVRQILQLQSFCNKR